MKRTLFAIVLLLVCASIEVEAQNLRYSKDPNVHFQQFRFEIDPNGSLQLPLPRLDTPLRIDISVTHIAGDYLSFGDAPLAPLVLSGTLTKDSRTGALGVRPNASCSSTATYRLLDCSFINESAPNGAEFHLSALLEAIRSTNEVFLEFRTNETSITKPLNICINVYY